jgi:hypothetical protein
MPRYNLREDFETGLAVVTPFFESRGYTRAVSDPFEDKEGVFYVATFSLSPRSVELHHFHSLGPVIYRLGEASMKHLDYLQALGVASGAQYPTYEDNSQAAYPALLHDLRMLLTPFFQGPAQAFLDIASHWKPPVARGIHSV